MSIGYDLFGEKYFINELFENKPFVRDLYPIDHKCINVYKILQKINHPNIIKIYKIHKISKNIIAIDMEFFVPMTEDLEYYIFKESELSKLKKAIKILNEHNIILTILTREQIGFKEGQFKLWNFLLAGIKLSNNLYKWRVKPENFKITEKRLLKCDYFSYLSGVYKLTELDVCALKIFKMKNKLRKNLLHAENIELAEDEEVPRVA